VLEDIYNFLPLTQSLLTSGMPTAEQLADVSQAGIRVVINLAMPTSENALPGEPALVQSHGMKYIGIPVDWERPTPRDLEEFMDAMDAETGRTILVHCQANYRATGFVTLYRILRLGWKREDAFKDLHRIWDPDGYPVLRDFIHKILAAPPGSPAGDSQRVAGSPVASGSTPSGDRSRQVDADISH
jgi:protein tyrosine phosphatase (PTP) superfamily phosphohydrolase (DUF442 family)